MSCTFIWALGVGKYAQLGNILDLDSNIDNFKDKEMKGQGLSSSLDCKSCTTLMMCVGPIAMLHRKAGPQCDILLMGRAGN